jgi:uncharacterized membrane protein affecting hemolysin expression
MNKSTESKPKGNSANRSDPVSVEDPTPGLFRYYIAAGLAALAVVAIVLGIILRQFAVRDLLNQVEAQNIAMAQQFTNLTWPQFASFVEEASGLGAEALRDHPETANLRQALQEQVDDPAVVGITLYDREGLIVCSTDAAEIGEYRSYAGGFVSATQRWYRERRITTALAHHDTFNAIEGTITNREIASSYVPIEPSGATWPVEGVLQISHDVTHQVQAINHTLRNAMAVIMVILAVLMGLSLLARRRVRGG